MSTEPSLFDAAPPIDGLRNCANAQSVDASQLGAIRSVVLSSDDGAEIHCEHGLLTLSMEQWFGIVKYRKPPIEVSL